MLTLRDFLDYCDLTEAEVAKIALREHVPLIVAAQLALLRKQLGLISYDSAGPDRDPGVPLNDQRLTQRPPIAG